MTVLLSEKTAFITLFINAETFNGLKAAELITIWEKVVEWVKRLRVEIFEHHCGRGLFTLSFHVLRLLAKHMRKMYSMEMFYASPFDRFHVRVK